MGAWGTGIFDNDTACDWAHDLEELGVSFLRTTIETAATTTDPIDPRDAECAIAACEVVAMLMGQKLKDPIAYTETVERWAEDNAHAPDGELVRMAIEITDRVVAADSDLAQLWGTDDTGQAWRANIADLKRRLML